jgi:hypothetical protein
MMSVAKAAEMGAHFRSIDEYFQPPIPQNIFDVILQGRVSFLGPQPSQH